MWASLSFAAVLGLVAFVVARGDDTRLQRTALILGLNWAAGVVSQSVSGDVTPWAALLVIDAVAAYAVLHPPACRVQALIGGLLIAQILWHAAFGYVGTSHSAGVYLTALNSGGWIQVAILFGGATYDKGRGLAAAWRGRRSGAPAPAAVHSSVAERGQS